MSKRSDQLDRSSHFVDYPLSYSAQRFTGGKATIVFPGPVNQAPEEECITIPPPADCHELQYGYSGICLDNLFIGFRPN